MRLVDAGFTYIALGGLAARPTIDVHNTVAEVASRLPAGVRLHILGFNRIDKIDAFCGLPVCSFDSSSPMIKSFTDDRHNYFSPSGNHYRAIRMPSLDEAKVRRRIATGELPHDLAQRIDAEALDAIRQYAKNEIPIDEALSKLETHASLFFPGTKSLMGYERALRDRPWQKCACAVCARLGVEVLIFRGLNRNKRRGYHNLFVFSEKLRRLQKMNHLEVPCIKAQQTNRHAIYTFVVDGKDLAKFAAVSRIGRLEAGDLQGYQRSEIAEHITEIREYLERDDALLPNSIVLAFNNPVTFVPAQALDGPVVPGTLQIDIGAEKPAWIVDGQQRAAAFRQIKRAAFPVSVVAFVSKGIDMEREQFVLVNSTRPLPKSLVYELLPCIGTSAPARLRKRQTAYRILAKLNADVGSPFHNRIATATSGLSPEASIKDLSVLKMIENSYEGGILQSLGMRGAESFQVLCNYWSAVRDLYACAWQLPPRQSRLTHGVGIVSMGYIMDALGHALTDGQNIPSQNSFRLELQKLGTNLAWTTGEWRFSDQHIVPWNELQNTSRHIDLLSNHLIRRYKHSKAHCVGTTTPPLATVSSSPS
jgi:DGQHR domain-containing protein